MSPQRNTRNNDNEALALFRNTTGTQWIGQRNRRRSTRHNTDEELNNTATPDGERGAEPQQKNKGKQRGNFYLFFCFFYQVLLARGSDSEDDKDVSEAANQEHQQSLRVPYNVLKSRKSSMASFLEKAPRETIPAPHILPTITRQQPVILCPTRTKWSQRRKRSSVRFCSQLSLVGVVFWFC